MSTYTLAQVQADIATARTAINAIMDDGQSVSMNGRTYSAANLGELRAHLSWLLQLEQSLTRGGIRSRRAVLKR